ncbi:MAG: hypothetical protein KF729_02675 [Sandaracinaceae bacterium]|nr:hypothetical protein [Sandaracinaceae bacterium]
MTHATEERLALLLAMYHQARLDGPTDLGMLAGRLGWGVGRVVRVLAVLDDKGLVERPRCRLTMAGLALATALAAASSPVRAARAA